jgi:hypothetical protein
MTVLRDMGGALEHHMLEEMGESCSTGLLVPRSHGIPEIDGHDGNRLIEG